MDTLNITEEQKIKLDELAKEYQPKMDELERQEHEDWIRRGKPLDGGQTTELVELMKEYTIKRIKIVLGKE